MYKLSHLVDGRWAQHSYRPEFSIGSVGGVDRVAAGVPGGDPTPFERLVLSLEEPYLLLYVLHTPRGEGDAGRYQSPELTSAQFRAFVERFGAYLSSDARFDLWAYSPSERATVVWDRHNQLFAYGPLARFDSELSSLGFQQTEWESAASVPHQHHYRVENDADAQAVLAWSEWTRTPLRPEDEQ
jgi:hypothetical protein